VTSVDTEILKNEWNLDIRIRSRLKFTLLE